jgi:hypothetical protein
MSHRVVVHLQLLQDLMSFRGKVEEQPFHHIWWYQDIRWEESVLFNSPTAGVDFISTFEVSLSLSLSLVLNCQC